MGYSLIAASQHRDSPVDEYSYISGRGLVSLEDTQSLAMPTYWSPLGGTEAGKHLMGGMYRGSHPLQTLLLTMIVYLHSWEQYLDVVSASLSTSVLNRVRLRHDVRMLNWLLLGDGDIWAANYYVLSCTVLPLALNLSLNISGQERPFSQCKKKIGVYYESECSLVILNMLLTAHCITRHVIWKLGSLIFTLDFFFLFESKSVTF